MDAVTGFYINGLVFTSGGDLWVCQALNFTVAAKIYCALFDESSLTEC